MLELALNVPHPWVRGEKMAFVCETERLSRLKDTPVLHTSLKHRTRRLFKRISSGKEKLKCSRAVVCLCLCIHAVKWQKPEFLRVSLCVRCVWIS